MSKSMVELKRREGGQAPLPGRPVVGVIMCMVKRGTLHVSTVSAEVEVEVVGRAFTERMRRERIERKGVRDGIILVDCMFGSLRDKGVKW